MEWNKNRQLNELPKISRAISPEDTRGVTVIEDLVNQAVDMFQSIEDRAAETNARALDLARRATEQLKLTERRTCALKSALSAADANLNQAQVRADEAEQAAIATQAQIASGAEDRLSTAEDRAGNAEARAIEAEEDAHCRSRRCDSK